ncbi:hypothetical protein HZA98_02940 [Candidatus Woesearchaeota archaeon]|nr:hypothetical protein [Candidatus Woesearchaeota archaeon]
MNKDDVSIMVVPRASLFSGEASQGFIPHAEHDYLSVILQKHAYMRRGDAERNPAFKQPIPYAFIINPGIKTLFAYQRASKKEDAHEERLHGRWSLGVGGHIDNSDALLPLESIMKLGVIWGKGDTALVKGLARELHEEVDIQGNILSVRLLGYINDDSDEVGRVHLGLVYAVKTNAFIVMHRGGEIVKSGMYSPLEIESLFSDTNSVVENWSKIAGPPVLDAIFRNNLLF